MLNKVYIASMNLRGSWAKSPPNSKKVNVTSAQSKSSAFRLQLSPMHVTVDPYTNGFHCLENYWQSGKRYEGLTDPINIRKQLDWWKSQSSGKRKYPLGKGKRVLHAIFSELEFNDPLDYISSREKVYIPLYVEAVKDSPVLKDLRKILETSSITIYDFDGPRLADGTPTCLELTEDLFYEKLNDPTFPFGHGYIVGALLKDMI